MQCPDCSRQLDDDGNCRCGFTVPESSGVEEAAKARAILRKLREAKQ